MHTTFRPASRALDRAGSSMAIRSAMIAMTTSNSISVNARADPRVLFFIFQPFQLLPEDIRPNRLTAGRDFTRTAVDDQIRLERLIFDNGGQKAGGNPP